VGSAGPHTAAGFVVGVLCDQFNTYAACAAASGTVAGTMGPAVKTVTSWWCCWSVVLVCGTGWVGRQKAGVEEAVRGLRFGLCVRKPHSVHHSQAACPHIDRRPLTLTQPPPLPLQ
jgi:hypothetical protein